MENGKIEKLEIKNSFFFNIADLEKKKILEYIEDFDVRLSEI